MLFVGVLDFGFVVDVSVIMVEIIFCYMVECFVYVEGGCGHYMMVSCFLVVLGVSYEVSCGIFFVVVIIIVSFLLFFMFIGVEGYIFGLMVKIYVYVIIGGLIVIFIVVLVLVILLFLDKLFEVEICIVV